ECPVTVCKKVACCEQVKCKVAVCRNEWREEKVKVCSYECRTEQRTVKYTCYERRTVPCTATRTVRVCVPCQETVNCCRMVPRTVTRQVPCCDNGCNNNNNNCCNNNNSCCNNRGGLFSGLGSRLRHNGNCCRSSCQSSCCN